MDTKALQFGQEMERAAHIAFLDFHRRLHYGPDVSIEDRRLLAGKVKQLLIQRLPELLAAQDQAAFGQMHHALCLDILCVYEPVCPQHYGIAQRWVNQTLMELLSLASGEPLVARSRQFFHVPVDQGWVLKVATTRRKDRFRHGLGLKAAPLKHDPSGRYEMGWYHLGKSQPFDDWEYPEYMEFQLAVREALAGPIREGRYQDVADWAIRARQETRPYNMRLQTKRGNPLPNIPVRKDRTPDNIYGKVSMKNVTAMSELSLERGNVLVEGDVFSVDHKKLRGHNTVVRFDLTDYTGSIRISQFMRNEEATPIIKGVKKGQHLLIQGWLEMDRYEGDLVLRPTGIALGEKAVRQDTAPQKRVELHLHTNMSAMDALTDTAAAVRRALSWGHRAIAITDHGVAHSFPDADRAAAKTGIKILYGVEAYMDNTADQRSEEEQRKPYHLIILAKNPIGLRNLYKLISLSHLEHYSRNPIMPKNLINENREGLIIGSACEAGELFKAITEGKPQEELERIAQWYDYLEIQPISNNAFMLRPGKDGRQIAQSEESLQDFNRKVVELGEKLGKPVCATGDVHFLEPHDEIYRHILLDSKGFDDADSPNPLYFRTTDEMLEEFSYLGEEKAFEVVVTNTNLIADLCDCMSPLPHGLFLPTIENSAQILSDLVWGKAKELYGNEPPQVVVDRINAELSNILRHNYDVIYLIAQKLVQGSLDRGYLVGSRASVGSSIVAFMSGITEIDPLPPHYRCPNCKHADFDVDAQYGCGADLPDNVCPICGTLYEKDGFHIPFETFLGLNGENMPDIDLNFSGEYQRKAIEHLKRLFGNDHVFWAGTVGTIPLKTAYGYVKKYLEQRGLHATKAEENRLANGCTGVKRTTGQHPGGMVVIPQNREIYDFCPVQRPAADTDTDIITTHFEYYSMKSNLLKLDMLGHDDPSMLHMLEELTGVDPRGIPLDDPDTMSLFTSSEKLGFVDDPILGPTGTVAIPELSTRFTRQALMDTQPKNFSTLVRLSGFSHGTDVWLGNARDLILDEGVSVLDTVSCRDDIMLYLIRHGIDRETAFAIMEAARKGNVKEDGFQDGWVEEMKAHDVPQWYIDSLAKIGYLFSKAHAVAYVMMAFRIAWFKVHHPLAFYAAYFTIRAEDFAPAVMCQGMDQVKAKIAEISEKGQNASWAERDMMATLETCYEFYLRGYDFVLGECSADDELQFRPMGETHLQITVKRPELR